MNLVVTISLIIFGIVAIIVALAISVMFYSVARAIKQATDVTIEEMKEDRERKKRMEELRDDK